MPALNKFLIVFTGLLVKDNRNDPNQPRYVLQTKIVSEDCSDIIAARAWAVQNMHVYLPPSNDYAHVDFEVEDYVKSGSSSRTFTEASEPVKNNLTENLDPIVQAFLMDFWGSNKQVSFMNMLLKDKLAETDKPKAQWSIRASYMTDVLLKDKAVELRIFHKVVTDKFLRKEILQRIYDFLDPLSGQSSKEESKQANTKA